MRSSRCRVAARPGPTKAETLVHLGWADLVALEEEEEKEEVNIEIEAPLYRQWKLKRFGPRRKPTKHG